MSRRMKPAWLAPCLLLCALGACTPSEPASAPAQEEAPAIIDAHIHTDFTNKPEPTSGIQVSREELLREMRAAGVVGAVAHTGSGGEGYVDLRAEHVATCAGVDAKVDVARVEAGLVDRRYRCIKIYLGYVHQFAGDPNYRPAYELAERYRVPVVFHTGDTYSSKAKLKYSDPLTVCLLYTSPSPRDS